VRPGENPQPWCFRVVGELAVLVSRSHPLLDLQPVLVRDICAIVEVGQSNNEAPGASGLPWRSEPETLGTVMAMDWSRVKTFEIFRANA
jgi:hypothetical protein